MRSALVMVAVMATVPATAIAQGRDRGATLAEHWCMGCHVIEPETRGAPPGRAPSFVAIAARPGTTAQSVALRLSTGHTNMPDFKLSRDESDDLVGYILSLRPRR